MESEWEPLDEPPSPPRFSSVFERDRHVVYMEMMYQLLPSPYGTQEINRLTLAYFVISGLHLLSALDRVLSLSLFPFARVWYYNLTIYLKI
jgi:hypothetical protein